MYILNNPHRSGAKLAANAPYPSVEASKVGALLSRCPAAKETPLVDATGLAPVAKFWIKDERERMNLGSFKALGAAYVIATHAVAASPTPDATTLRGRTYVTASAGNHGMSVAAGAKVFGAQAVVFISETVPETFAERLKAQNATVVRDGADYAASIEAAMKAANANGWTLLSDSSWDGYVDLPHLLMEGYLQMAAEAVTQCDAVPTHIFLQAGVGGMAGAAAAYARKAWGDEPQIIIVEPDAAPALQASISAGKSTFADGPDSIMGRLDCKEPSLIALNGLARDADKFLTLSDDEVLEMLPVLEQHGLSTTASGGAGIAAAMRPDVQEALGIGPESRVLCILSEVAE
ncbi:pyridoxal-phosphate dependent enzyme [Actibacterium pelagium]|uniref:Diaminopropionate ammonia-lyase n=1 Tax=Actibacterium pelagium TaxID=2029103 RepID=A0A917AHQ7_9RHOB|nr:pyridoxal-phosphate dependent enzyme [Actibacterium pelagium]GGE52018.1 diaminopropionate ammonia-lyase [Actibacterium pelagium]